MQTNLYTSPEATARLALSGFKLEGSTQTNSGPVFGVIFDTIPYGRREDVVESICKLFSSEKFNVVGVTFDNLLIPSGEVCGIRIFLG